jgi:parvulin-like peptidyl-prolyl isomerase
MSVRFLALVPFALGAWLCAGEAPKDAPKEAEGELVNAIVAIVDNLPVTKMEVDARVAPLERDPKVTPEQYGAEWEKAREALIDEQLLLQEAKRQKIEIDPLEVNDEIKRLKEAGVDAEKNRDLLRDRLMVQRLLIGLQSAREVAPQEVAAYYEKHPDEFVLPERRHVLLMTIPARDFDDGKAGAKRKAEEVLGRLKKGEDFADVVKKISPGAAAEKGGDQGWVKKGAFFKALDDAVFRLNPGEVGELVEAPDAYLVVKVIGVQPPSRQSLAEARPAILERLQAERRQERSKELVERLRRNASIVRIDLRPKAPAKP